VIEYFLSFVLSLVVAPICIFRGKFLSSRLFPSLLFVLTNLEVCPFPSRLVGQLFGFVVICAGVGPGFSGHVEGFTQAMVSFIHRPFFSLSFFYSLPAPFFDV